MEIQKKEETLNININFFCNQKCIFCSEGDKSQFNFLKDYKDENYYKRIESGNLKYKKIVFTTGEPTLHKNIFKYINYAGNYYYNTISMITNGSTLIDFNIRNQIINSSLNEIIISIHGSNSKIHDYITNVNGAFDNVMKGLILLKKDGYKGKINISYVLNKYNLHDFLSSVKLFSKLGINLHLINVMRPEGNGKIHKDKLSITYNEFINYFLKLKEKDIIFINSLIGQNKLNIMDIPICILKDSKLNISGYGKVEIMNNSSNENKECINNTLNNKTKLKICNFCKYNNECEGLYKDYLNINENFKLKPIIDYQFNKG
ncbi:MAG: radical SAM protein [Candidatus Gracilibacteria bacterium]|nr:radical SAM protein [Candidatus Gracilibacteria bacterium]